MLCAISFFAFQSSTVKAKASPEEVVMKEETKGSFPRSISNLPSVWVSSDDGMLYVSYSENNAFCSVIIKDEAGYEVFSSSLVADSATSEFMLSLISGIKYTIYIESQSKLYTGTFSWK